MRMEIGSIFRRGNIEFCLIDILNHEEKEFYLFSLNNGEKYNFYLNDTKQGEKTLNLKIVEDPELLNILFNKEENSK